MATARKATKAAPARKAPTKTAPKAPSPEPTAPTTEIIVASLAEELADARTALAEAQAAMDTAAAAQERAQYADKLLTEQGVILSEGASVSDDDDDFYDDEQYLSDLSPREAAIKRLESQENVDRAKRAVEAAAARLNAAQRNVDRLRQRQDSRVAEGVAVVLRDKLPRLGISLGRVVITPSGPVLNGNGQTTQVPGDLMTGPVSIEIADCQIQSPELVMAVLREGLASLRRQRPGGEYIEVRLSGTFPKYSMDGAWFVDQERVDQRLAEEAARAAKQAEAQDQAQRRRGGARSDLGTIVRDIQARDAADA